MGKSSAIIAATWVVAVGASVALVKLTSIGPVVLVVNQNLGMGVHVGDTLVVVPLGLAVHVTRLALRYRKR